MALGFASVANTLLGAGAGLTGSGGASDAPVAGGPVSTGDISVGGLNVPAFPFQSTGQSFTPKSDNTPLYIGGGIVLFLGSVLLLRNRSKR